MHDTAAAFCLALGPTKISTLNKIRRTLEGAGVEFIDDDGERGAGVRLQKGKPAGKRK